MANTTGKKYGGRKRGTRNKITKDIKTMLRGFIESEMEFIQQHIDELTVNQRAQILAKLLPYIIPKQMHIDQTNLPNDGKLLHVTFTSTGVKLPTSEAEIEEALR